MSAEELILLNCGTGGSSWESLGLRGYQTKSILKEIYLNIDWKDCYWRWSASTFPPDAKSRLIGKDPNDAKKLNAKEGVAEYEIIR